MSVVVIGINHTTAPLDILERVSIGPARLNKALDAVAGCDNVSETVVLSTCNRTEIYVLAERFHGAFQDVRDTLCDLGGVSPEELGDHLYVHYDEEAVRHLFAVAAGLDSAVIGEHEIQGQVKTAWENAHTLKVTGTALNGVFRHALEVGKRARTETKISHNIASVSQAAIAMAADRLGGLSGKRILILGAGEMGEGMVARLMSSDMAELVVANRTFAKAETLARRLDGRAVRLSELSDELHKADIVFTSTGAHELIVEATALETAMDVRNGRPLLLIDIAMPRDIDPSAASIPGITLLDMDDIREFAQMGISKREREIADVRNIIEVEVNQYAVRSSARDAAPLIADFRQQAEQIRTQVLTANSSKLEDLDPETRELLELITNRLVGKLLHLPTTRLKDSAGTARGERIGEALRDLYDLD